MSRPVTIDTQSVIEAVKNTFETMTFMEVMPLEIETALEIEEPYWAAIQIIEPVRAKLVMILPAVLAEEITETLFTPEPGLPLPENIALDTLAELVNTIAGRLMSDQVNLEHTLSISLPEYGRGLPETKNGRIINLTVEEMHPITVLIEDLT